MPLRLSGKNFQPWEDFSIDIDKLTLIVGDTNKGKSSLFRSLRGILRNELSTEYVRNGQNGKMEVTLEVDGTDPITASRTRKSSTKYEIGKDENGKPIEYKALGDSIPEPLEKLKFGKVKVGETVMDPIFSEQNRSQFLIDPERWKPTDLNAVLGAFSSTERLDAGKKEANLRITRYNSEATTLAKEIRDGEERKNRLTTLSEQTEAELLNTSRLEKYSLTCDAQVTLLTEAIKRTIRASQLHDIVAHLRIPEITGAENLHLKYELFYQAAKHSRRRSTLRGVESSIDNTVAAWDITAKTYKRRKAVLELLSIKQREGLAPKECSEQLGMVLTSVELILLSASKLSTIAKIASTVQAAREMIENKGKDLAEVAGELEQASAEVSLLRGQVDKKSLPLCPKCGKNLSCQHCEL